MSKIETLTAYKCTFSYLKRNNPLKEELKNKVKDGELPDYTFSNFVEDYSKFTSDLAVGKSTERAIFLPEDKVHNRVPYNETNRWILEPYAGKQGKPFKIIKTTTGKKYDFGADSAALYEHKIFMYECNESFVIIFHRQNGSGCKTVFLETANQMLKSKGIKLEMELYLPLADTKDDVVPKKITLQYYENNISSDKAENMKKRKGQKSVRDLGLNLESEANKNVLNIIKQMINGQIDKDVAFARIKLECLASEDYNDAEISISVGKRSQKVKWNDFDSILGNYDITEELHQKYADSNDFVKSLSEITDNYYESIKAEENDNE